MLAAEMTDPVDGPAASAWEIVCRWRQYQAELRVNALRVVALAVFYLTHLLRFRVDAGFGSLALQDSAVAISQQRHLAITVIVAAWVLWSLLVHVLLLDRVFPRRLPLFSICVDSLLLTAVLLCGSGAASPMVCGYFLIVMMAGLRLNLNWVKAATGCCLVGYVVLLGCARWPQGVLLAQPHPVLPRYHQFVLGLAIVMSGVIVGQIVRHVRQLAFDLQRVSGQERQA